MLNWSKYHKTYKNPNGAKGIALLKAKNAQFKTIPKKLPQSKARRIFNKAKNNTKTLSQIFRELKG